MPDRPPWEDYQQDDTPPWGAEAASKAEGIGPAPEFQQGIKLSSLIGPTGGETRLPISLSNIAESAPGIGSLLGMLGGGGFASAGTGAIGAGLGEIVRQRMRSAAGFAPATGAVQQLTGMDPKSGLAQAAGVGAEAAGGAIPGLLEGLLKPATTPLRESALRSYARILEPEATAGELGKTVETIRPAASELPLLPPVGARRSLESTAERQLSERGKAVGAIYNRSDPSSYHPAIDKLEQLARENIKYPVHEAPMLDEMGEVVTNELGDPVMETVPPVLKNRPLATAISERQRGLIQQQRAAENLQGSPTVKDVYETRRTTDDAILRSQSRAFGKKAAELKPNVQAMRAERQALSDTLHKTVPGGKEADALFAAWSKVKEGAEAADPSSFLARWTAARTIPGKAGTIVGSATGNPAFWRSLSATTKRGLANALDSGNASRLAQALRAARAATDEATSISRASGETPETDQ